jgi:hypothetical protein
MLLLDVVKIPIWLSLAVIGSSLAVAVIASLRATRDLLPHDRQLVHDSPEKGATR